MDTSSVRFVKAGPYGVAQVHDVATGAEDHRCAPAGDTADERARAQVVFDDVGGLDDDDPRRQTLRALLGAWRPGDDWDDMFDRLTLPQLAELKRLFPYMPPRAARHFAVRYVGPAAQHADAVPGSQLDEELAAGGVRPRTPTRPGSA